MKRFLLLCLCLAFITASLLVSPVCLVTVKGTSMMPTLKDGQRLLAVTSAERIRRIKVGDIVAFRHDGKTYIKRCVGCPGDTVSIVNGIYRNSGTDFTGVPPESQSCLSDSSLEWYASYPGFKAYQFSPELGWSIRDFGPLYLPHKGDSSGIGETEKSVHRDLLELKGEKRTFLHDWYFFAGDNVISSNDSRYFGLISEDEVIGVAVR